MKKIVLTFIYLSFLIFGKAQRVNFYLNGNLFGTTLFHGIGVGANYIFKDSSKIGLNISSSFIPETKWTNGTMIPLSLQFNFTSQKIFKGKTYIRIGTTNYYTEVIENSQTKNYIHNAFNFGLGYNILKIGSNSELYIGADALIYLRKIGDPKYGNISFIPIPTIQYRYNLN